MAASGTEPQPSPDPLKLDRCPRCSYSLRELHDTGLCPECGLPYSRYEIVLYSQPASEWRQAKWLFPTIPAGVAGLAILESGQICLAGAVSAVLWFALLLLTHRRAKASPASRVLLGPQGYAECLANGQAVQWPWRPGLYVRLTKIDRKTCCFAIIASPPSFPSNLNDATRWPGNVDLVVACDPDQAAETRERIATWCNVLQPDQVDKHRGIPPLLPRRRHRPAYRGVHLSLTSQQVERLRSFEDWNDCLCYVASRMAENDPRHRVETDLAWNIIHRCLTDGSLGLDNGQFPLSHVILGGEQLCGDEHCFSLKVPVQVTTIAEELGRITQAFFFEGYDLIDPADYGKALSERDLRDAWGRLEELIPFYQEAAREGRFVLFSLCP